MNHLTKISVILFMAAAVLAPIRVVAQTPLPATTGPISIDAKDSEARQGSVVYHFAHVTLTNGTTLDTDELKAIETKDNKLDEATATGNVKAFVNDIPNNRTYTVTSDSAIFDPVANTIDLNGNVKAIIKSQYTVGPIVQTGTSATIYLGKGPDFPKIEMRQVHAVLNVKQ
jgi:lipopolysaccharide export system protein LptA